MSESGFSVFEDTYIVKAPLAVVAGFHSSTLALRRLTPPPVIVQFHHVEPLAEGSKSEFSMWFGPFPIRWVAIHSHVNPMHGFIDTQISGPMASWQHTHAYESVDDQMTRMHERIEYRHHTGARGWLTRLLFSRPGLSFMAAHRRRVIQQLA